MDVPGTPTTLHRLGDRWVESAPPTCARGHALGPRTVLVGSRACSCGRGHHRTHACRTCGDITFTPPLGPRCSDASFDSRGSDITGGDIAGGDQH